MDPLGLTEELMERERRDEIETGCWLESEMRRDVHLRLDMRETNCRAYLDLVDR